MAQQTYGGNLQVVSTQFFPGRQRLVYLAFKRVFDLVLALLLSILFLPLSILITIAIVLDSSGSPILVQKRVGKNGRQFKFYKFRSMRPVQQQRDGHRAFMKTYVNSYINGDDDTMNQVQKDNNLFKPKEQNRVTKVGRLLRKTSLDELPQLFNIIKGDMSFVGPRPPIYYEVEEYKSWHFRRFETQPGITGLAQINGRSQIPFADIVRWDIQYSENQSLFLDLMILLRTIPSVLSGQGSG